MSTRTRAIALPSIDLRVPALLLAALAMLTATTLLAGCEADAGADDDAVDIVGE